MRRRKTHARKRKRGLRNVADQAIGLVSKPIKKVSKFKMKDVMP